MAQLAVPVLVVKPHHPTAGRELLARAQAQFGRVLVGTGHNLWSGMSQAVIVSSWSGCALARLSLHGQGKLAGGRTFLCRCARRHFFDKKIRKRSGGREGEKKKRTVTGCGWPSCSAVSGQRMSKAAPARWSCRGCSGGWQGVSSLWLQQQCLWGWDKIFHATNLAAEKQRQNQLQTSDTESEKHFLFGNFNLTLL